MSAPSDDAAQASGGTDPLDAAFAQLDRLLPQQGPIGVFVHHNTLHAFEGMAFEDATVHAGRLFGAAPFMPEDWYRQRLEEGRISSSDIDAALEAGSSVEEASVSFLGGRLSRRDLRRTLLLRGLMEPEDASIPWLLEEEGLLVHPLSATDPVSTRAVIAETTTWLSVQLKTSPEPLSLFDDPFAEEGAEARVLLLGGAASASGLRTALRRRPAACAMASLWSACAARVIALREPEEEAPRRPRRMRDLLLELSGRDTDEVVHEHLIPLVAAFLDQGLAYWPMPDRALGFYETVRRLILQGPPSPIPVIAGVRRIFAEQNAVESPRSALVQALRGLGHEEKDWADVLAATALALPGWTGIMRKLEKEPELAPHHAPPCSLVEFLTVRLIFDLAAASYLAKELDHEGPTAALWRRHGGSSRAPDAGRVQAFALFQVAQLGGLSTPAVLALADEQVREVLAELSAFDTVERRRVLHLAYERRHRQDVLGALQLFRHQVKPEEEMLEPAPRLQVAFCIDEREESLRRHIEELGPDVETLGVAGFFGVAIAYRGIDDGHHADLCPVAAKPEHEIRELSVDEDEDRHRRYLGRRKMLSGLLHGSYVGSRGLLRGWLATFVVGLLSLVPLSVRVLFPRSVSRINGWLQRTFFPRPRTRLALRRDGEERGSLQLFPGFSKEEMASRVGRVLEDVGLRSRFSPLVAVVGHGSSSLNNPHESAHDCGACGGRRGGPNARLFAQMANDREVREILRRSGLRIPDSTVFVGGYHDTCNDGVTWFDLDQVPSSHQEHLGYLRDIVEQARMLDAHERCRRFESVPLEVLPETALLHVEGRSEDLAEPRPEYGHATNAICIFGRRSLTRGLFLDRRAFLVSYDPTTDPDGEILGRLLAAMGPVGAGINLEYYFSFVDNERYGCGTKLPHNVTGLLGVMNGPLSDLRTGLPWQMVEIHEPVRLLVVVEATAEIIARVAERHPAIGQLVENRWIQLALIDPSSGEVRELVGGELVPVRAESSLPTVTRSHDWYFGHREHLPIAAIRQGMKRTRARQ